MPDVPEKWPFRVLGVILAISLTVTGIYDFVVILKDNDSSHRVGVKLQSNLTAWLDENLRKDDLLLTPEYSMNEVTMAGVMLYMGWPYYAWSAGYDTYYRGRKGSFDVHHCRPAGTEGYSRSRTDYIYLYEVEDI